MARTFVRALVAVAVISVVEPKGGVVLGSFAIKTLLTGLLFGSGLASIAVASEASDVSNIGFVLYTKSYAPGTLNARWMYANKYSGPGIATGGPKEGFAGNYQVRYFYDGGVFLKYDLVIGKTRHAYRLSTPKAQ